jgi:hypothetical protein
MLDVVVVFAAARYILQFFGQAAAEQEPGRTV